MASKLDLLFLILHQINDSNLVWNGLPNCFFNSVVTHYNSYLTSSYRYLVEMYPVNYMHLSFFEAYKSYFHQGYDLNSFSHFFIPHQSQSGIKYKKFILTLYHNMDQIYNLTALTLSMNQLSLGSKDLVEDLDHQISQLSLGA